MIDGSKRDPFGLIDDRELQVVTLIAGLRSSLSMVERGEDPSRYIRELKDAARAVVDLGATVKDLSSFTTELSEALSAFPDLRHEILKILNFCLDPNAGLD